MREPILESNRYHILISYFIFKSQFLPRLKISNLLRFWISIDLNILKSFLGEKRGQFLMFSDKRNSFLSLPINSWGRSLCAQNDEFLQKIFDILWKTLWNILILAHNTPQDTFIAFVQSVATRWYFERILKSLSPSINDPILTNYCFYTNNGLDTNFINKILLSLIEWWSLRK